MILIPFDPTISADQEFTITLGDYATKIRLQWNERSGYWLMGITGDFGEAIGLKVVAEWPLLRGKKDLSTFVGDFLVRPLTKDAVDTEIGYFDLGVRWGLCYITKDEYITWEENFGLA